MGSRDPREKEEGRDPLHRGGKGRGKIEVTASGYGGGTTIVVLSPVNKGWVTPDVPEAKRGRERKALRDPDFRLLPFISQSFLRRVAYGM